MLSRIVPQQDLLSAIGLQAAGWQGSTVVGPLVGGLLIGPIGVGGLFLIKALSHATTLYAGLGALVLVWAWRGEWFDAYDALLWLIAFVTIEIDVLQISRAQHPGAGADVLRSL